MGKKLYARMVWLVVVGGLVAGAIFWYHSYAARASEPKFDTKAITRGDVEETVLTTGTVQPIRTVSVGSQVSGLVTKLYVDWNSPVHKDEVLAQIDPSLPKAALEQGEADLENAQATLTNNEANLQNMISNLQSADSAVKTAQAQVDTARVGILSAQAQLNQAQAAVAKARAQLELAQVTYRRDETLRKRDLIAQVELDTSESGFHVAQSDVATARAQLETARAGVRTAQVSLQSAQTGVQAAMEKRDGAQSQVLGARSQVAEAEATVKRARANLVGLKMTLGYTVIRSPVDGIVISRLVDVGQTVQAAYSVPNLFTLGTDLKHMQVIANLDESDMARVFDKEKARFQVDAWPNETFEGYVYQVRDNPTTVNNVVTYQVVINAENPDQKLKPGMTANITLSVRRRQNVLLVPNMALRFQPEGHKAFEGAKASPSPSASPQPKRHHHQGDLPDEQAHQKVWILKDGQPAPLDVTTGITDGINTEVLAGLSQDQQVITGNVVSAASGSPHSLF